MGGAPSIPQQDPAAVFAAIRQNLGPMVQKQYGLANQYGPQFAQQDISQLQQNAPQYLGINLGQMQKNIAAQPLLSGLNTQAQQGLALGGQLSSGELRNVTQGTLAGFAARGNAGGNQALAQEFLNRDVASQQRQQQRQQFASQVQGLNLQQLQGLGGVSQPGGSFAPMGAGIGATSGTVGQVAPIVSSIFDANQSAAANQAIGGANKSSGIAGGALSAVGSIAAAY